MFSDASVHVCSLISECAQSTLTVVSISSLFSRLQVYYAEEITHRFPFFPLTVLGTGPVENSIIPTLPVFNACFILQMDMQTLT